MSSTTTLISYAVDQVHPVGASETALDTLVERARKMPERAGFYRSEGDGWVAVSYGDLLAKARRLACGLVEAGVQPGDRVALMSRTRLEWTLWDYAIWLAAAVSVPVYETSSEEQVEWILSDSGAIAAVVETRENAELIAGLDPKPSQLRNVWTIDAGDADQLEHLGRFVLPDVLSERRARLVADSIATIIYTSGTTGRPKGCTITHRNLVAVLSNTCNAPGIPEVLNEQSTVLLFLPLAHCLARVIQLSCVYVGAAIAYSPDAKLLPEQLKSFRPTVLLSVPRVFEKVYNHARHDAHKRRVGWIFDRAERVAVRYSEELDAGPGWALRVRHALYDRLVYRPLRAALGGRLEWSVSGGAPLGSRLGHFFRGAGINILEGYGMTETATAATLNLPGRQKVGSVGPPCPGCEIRIAEDGEVLLRGEFVMPGYWQNDVATKETIDDDGWLHTGDIGELDASGFLSITGRKKEILVTAGGKNVAPAVLEDRLRAHELVSQCIVVGDAKPFVGCLITLDEDAFAQWKADRRREGSTIDLRTDAELQAELQAAVDRANAAVSHAEGIRRWVVLERDFTEAGGELTPTLKVKRQLIVERYHEDVESLYR